MPTSLPPTEIQLRRNLQRHQAEDTTALIASKVVALEEVDDDLESTGSVLVVVDRMATIRVDSNLQVLRTAVQRREIVLQESRAVPSTGKEVVLARNDQHWPSEVAGISLDAEPKL